MPANTNNTETTTATATVNITMLDNKASNIIASAEAEIKNGLSRKAVVAYIECGISDRTAKNLATTFKGYKFKAVFIKTAEGTEINKRKEVVKTSVSTPESLQALTDRINTLKAQADEHASKTGKQITLTVLVKAFGSDAEKVQEHLLNAGLLTREEDDTSFFDGADFEEEATENPGDATEYGDTVF